MKTETKKIQKYLKKFTDKNGNQPDLIKVAVLIEYYTKSFIENSSIEHLIDLSNKYLDVPEAIIKQWTQEYMEALYEGCENKQGLRKYSIERDIFKGGLLKMELNFIEFYKTKPSK